MDPNFIPPSPSPSAVRRLSNYEAAPSLATSESKSDLQTEVQTERAISHAKSRSTRAPPIDTLPEISDFQSKMSEKSLPPKPPTTTETPKLSKLSMLASSRASSRTSRSSDLETTSVLTYPALRPTAESRLSFATTAATTKPPPSEKTLPKAPSTTTSSMSLHVKQAIKTALELEAHDRERETKFLPKKGETSSTSSRASSVSTVKPTVPTSPPRTDTIPNVVRAELETKARPQSKLAALAQAKAGANASLVPKFSKSPPSSPPKELPKPRTQYLTPIANGATVTTAITTSYQSLQSLSEPQTREPAPLVQMPAAEPKQSKLSMKIKKASEKPPPSTPTDRDADAIIPSPLFLPKPANPRASPSAFASLLLDDHLTSPSPEDKDVHAPHKYGREVPELVNVYEASHSQSRSTLSLSDKHKSSRPRAAPPELTVPSRFAFDVPSPDDIVFNARRGTSLAQRR